MKLIPLPCMQCCYDIYIAEPLHRMMKLLNLDQAIIRGEFAMNMNRKHYCIRTIIIDRFHRLIAWYYRIWVRSRNCGCLVTWFCYQLIAKPGNKTATVSWPDPYIHTKASGSLGGNFAMCHISFIEFQLTGNCAVCWKAFSFLQNRRYPGSVLLATCAGIPHTKSHWCQNDTMSWSCHHLSNVELHFLT